MYLLKIVKIGWHDSYERRQSGPPFLSHRVYWRRYGVIRVSIHVSIRAIRPSPRYLIFRITLRLQTPSRLVMLSCWPSTSAPREMSLTIGERSIQYTDWSNSDHAYVQHCTLYTYNVYVPLRGCIVFQGVHKAIGAKIVGPFCRHSYAYI